MSLAYAFMVAGVAMGTVAVFMLALTLRQMVNGDAQRQVETLAAEVDFWRNESSEWQRMYIDLVTPTDSTPARG